MQLLWNVIISHLAEVSQRAILTPTLYQPLNTSRQNYVLIDDEDCIQHGCYGYDDELINDVVDNAHFEETAILAADPAVLVL